MVSDNESKLFVAMAPNMYHINALLVPLTENIPRMIDFNIKKPNSLYILQVTSIPYYI